MLAFNPEPPICLDANAQNADVSDNVVITGNLSTNGTIAWTGPGTSPDGTFNPFDAGIGVHTLTVTYEEFNCTYNGTIDITVNDLPIADAGQDQTLTCNATSVDLGGSGNNQNPSTVSYSWSGNVTQPSSVFTSTTENGTFTLTATDQATGCVNTDEVEVIIDNEPPDLDAAVENISCFGRNDGTININGVSGGTPPYMFAYNGGALTSQQYFNNLGPGSHEIVVEDSNGCMDTVTFTINEPDELNVEIVIVTGENPVPLGDSIQISAVTNFAPELLTNVSWTPIDQFPLCNEVNLTNCLTAWVTPTGQTVYTVRIEAGPCAAEDNFQLNVKKIRPVYIPSAFSPNLEDGLNDGFQIFADPEVAVNVKSFLIFDRWGEVVFEAYDFEPSLMENPDNAWNGEFRGKKLNSGVFVYFAEIEFFDGITEIFKGDVTIR
ncbi:MAG: gliding motility-associated C-terminal domain-containing protein [Saprospiraceae bacterium]